MKKLTLIALLVSLFQLANAQETDIKNKLVLGGSMNFLIQNNTHPFSSLSILSGPGGIYLNSTNETKNVLFSFNPYFGKEINPYLVIGLKLNYGLGKYKIDDTFVLGQADLVDIERNSSQIGFGIFTRHILNPTNRFNFFIRPYFEYNLLNEEELHDSNVSQEKKANYLEIGAGMGILYNINNRISASLRTGGLTYINGKWEIKDTDTKKNFSSFGTNINLSTIFIGFEIRL